LAEAKSAKLTYNALDRLVKGKPTIVAKSAKINNDNVALEAGRKKGSIKKTRPTFEPLIDAIKAANEKLSKNSNQDKIKLIKAKDESLKYKALWEESLAREISLIHENSELKTQVKKLSNQKISKLIYS